MTNVPFIKTYVGDNLPTHWSGSNVESGNMATGIDTITSGGPRELLLDDALWKRCVLC